jgi:hypothetical protein
MCKEIQSNENFNEGDNMMTVKNEELIQNGVRYVPAKKADVLKAIKEMNQQHSKMLSKLAK